MKSSKLYWLMMLSCLSFTTIQAQDEVFYSPTRGVAAEAAVVKKDIDAEDKDENTQTSDEPIRILPARVEMETQARRAEEAEGYRIKGEESKEEEPKEEPNEESLNAKGVIDVIHPDSYHYPFSHAYNGEDITLNDYSSWYVHPWDRIKVLNWAATDLIFIKPNTSWFSSYKYVLHNEMLNESIDVNYIANSNLTTYWILDIDYYNGSIILSDGTYWPLNSSDYSVYKFWRPGDLIIVGLNDMWRNGLYQYILINAQFTNAPYCESN